jgi:hypothetical protein
MKLQIWSTLSIRIYSGTQIECGWKQDTYVDTVRQLPIGMHHFKIVGGLLTEPLPQFADPSITNDSYSVVTSESIA